jgi:hypothetical protein
MSSVLGRFKSLKLKQFKIKKNNFEVKKFPRDGIRFMVTYKLILPVTE